MAIGWFTSVAAADTYFDTRPNSTSWAALNDINKTSYLTFAYNRIRFHKDYSVPASPTATQLEKLQIAQAETAIYAVFHLFGEDKRKGIQAQGVLEAGIVKEIYFSEMLENLPLPPYAKNILEEFFAGAYFGVADFIRDENG